MSATMETVEFFSKPKARSTVKCENLKQLRKVVHDFLKEKDPSTVLALSDFDKTIADRTRDAIMSDSHGMSRKAFLERLKKIDHKLVDLIYEQSPYDLIEPEMPEVIESFKNLGATVLGFTSRRTGKATINAPTTVEDDFCVSLKKLNIQFSNIPSYDFDIPEDSIQMENPHLLPFEAPDKPKVVGGDENVTTVFTANYPKGLILEHLIAYLSTLKDNKITTVIMIDDNHMYLANMQAACEKMGINFLGLHYTFADTHKPELNEAIVAEQYDCLVNNRVWLSDAEAQEKIDARPNVVPL